jgi:hypothetical protein
MKEKNKQILSQKNLAFSSSSGKKIGASKNYILDFSFIQIKEFLVEIKVL